MTPPARKFQNPWPTESHGFLDILRWKLGIMAREGPLLPDAPDSPAGRIALAGNQIAYPPRQGWRVVWLGHSSFLLQGAGLSILVDPVFSDHCAPVPLRALRRHVAVPCPVAELPRIDAVLLTHSHYDHLDLPTLRLLGNHVPLWVPEGHKRWLVHKGFTRAREIPWMGSGVLADGVRLTATPARHFTARSLWDRNRGHWCGWLIEGAGCLLWHAGDSAYCPAFREIGARFGPLDFGMIPIGAYQPRAIMRAVHMNPEEAVLAFVESRCLRAVAMHWGTFRLTDEPLGEPPLRLKAALENHRLPPDAFVAGRVGECWDVVPEQREQKDADVAH